MDELRLSVAERPIFAAHLHEADDYVGRPGSHLATELLDGVLEELLIQVSFATAVQGKLNDQRLG